MGFILNSGVTSFVKIRPSVHHRVNFIFFHYAQTIRSKLVKINNWTCF